ncbi:MAG: hypothetical protein V7629_05935, partial [Motiliproteus sp.]
VIRIPLNPHSARAREAYLRNAGVAPEAEQQTALDTRTAEPDQPLPLQSATELASAAAELEQELELALEPSQSVPVNQAPQALPAPPAETAPADPGPLMLAALERRDYGEAADYLEALQSQQGLTATLELEAIKIYRRGAQAVETQSPRLAARRYFDSAKLQIKHDQSEAALPSLKRSLELDADNPTTAEVYSILQQDFADKYHHQAATAYRQQELERAISLWDRVLEIDPDHNAAKAYRAQALELQQKLNKLQAE